MKGYKIIIIFALSIIAIQPMSANSEDVVFQNSADEIVSQLQKQEDSKFGLSRAFIPAGPPKMIEVMKEKNEIPVKDTINVYATDLTQNVKLKIEFDVDSYEIRESSYPLLFELAKAITVETLSNKVIQIGGHADSDGSDIYNLELSYKRALAIKNFLTTNYEINPKRIIILGYGESIPLVPNTDNAHKRLNRRVEIKLYKANN